MLVLSRREKETLRIGPTTVTVIRGRNGKVKLGIDAPSEWAIVRGELDEAIGPDDDTVIHGEDGE